MLVVAADLSLAFVDDCYAILTMSFWIYCNNSLIQHLTGNLNVHVA
jgi:hypothetical protein